MLKKRLKSDKAANSSKVSKEEWGKYLAETKGLERDYMAEIVDSRKKWQYAALLCFLFAILAVLFHQFKPVTITEPYVLRVDNSTGAVTAVSTVSDNQVSYGEAVDQYFLASFVKSYESYNYYSIQDDYDKTILMSSDAVADQYKFIFDSTNGKRGRDTVLGQTGTRNVNIVSVVPDTEKGIATVRFETMTESNAGVDYGTWVATITYEYVSAAIDANVRLLNPLGFVVTSYRVDQEIL